METVKSGTMTCYLHLCKIIENNHDNIKRVKKKSKGKSVKKLYTIRSYWN